MTKQDAKLVDHGAYYDFNYSDEGDIESEDAFDTSIIVSLFTDARADESEVPTPEDRRGWIGNLGQTFQIGSKLWMYSQSRSNDRTAQGVRSEVQSALKFFVDDGFVKSIEVIATPIENGIGFEVSINRYSSKVDTKYFELWNNTGN